MQKSDFDKALSLAYFYLKFRPRTTREVELYLERRAAKYRFSSEVIPEIIQELQEQNYLDDKKFVEMFVHDRLRFKPRSSFMIRKELEKLGVSKDIIESFFQSLPTDDRSTAISLLKKRLHTFQSLPQKKRFTKAMNYLKSKGFSYADSVSAYKEVEREG